MTDFWISGLPQDAPQQAAAQFRWRLITAAKQFARECPAAEVTVTVSSKPDQASSLAESGTGNEKEAYERVNDSRDTLSLEDRASYFMANEPGHTFGELVLPDSTMRSIDRAVSSILHHDQLYVKWNLRKIAPHPSRAINFHGLPGTGKTLAAHAIADRLGKKIIHARCSQLESKYHGEGPKNLAALFHAAQTHQAILFLDEAESLMSQRFEHISQGSEHAVNAMRSELFLCLDQFEGLAIFATNLVTSYDSAVHTRVKHIEFPLPDAAARTKIWRNNLPSELPLEKDVRIDELAAVEGVNGRDINNAVQDAATDILLDHRVTVTHADLAEAIERIRSNKPAHELDVNGSRRLTQFRRLKVDPPPAGFSNQLTRKRHGRSHGLRPSD